MPARNRADQHSMRRTKRSDARAGTEARDPARSSVQDGAASELFDALRGILEAAHPPGAPGGIDVEVRGRSFRIVRDTAGVLVTDITAERRAREARERLQWVLNDVADHVPLMFFIKSGSDLRFEYWSRSFEEFSGVGREH